MKFKVYLIRALLIFIALVIPAAVTTSCSMAGNGLGGLATVILYAPFLYFIYSVLNGKIGPQIPSAPKAEESRPVTPEMLAWDAENSDQDTETVSSPDNISEAPTAPAEAAQASPFQDSAHDSSAKEEQLLHVCPACGVISPHEQRLCDCGYDFDADNTTPAAVTPTDPPAEKKTSLRSRGVICVLLIIIIVVSLFLGGGWYQSNQQLSIVKGELSDINETLTESLETQRLLSLELAATRNLSDSYKQMYDALYSENSELNAQLEDAANYFYDAIFLYTRIGFIVNGSKYYHNYECSVFQSADEFWAHNIEYCEHLGYSKCPICWE